MSSGFQSSPGVDGAPGGQGPTHGVGAQGDDEEEDVALPVRGLPAQQLHVGPQHRVEEGVGAAESDLHDGGGRDVGVAVLLEPGHQARQGGAHISRPSGADHLRQEAEIESGGKYLSRQLTFATVSDNLEARCEACGSPVLARMI